MEYVLMLCMGYCLGCSNMALYLAKWKKVDLRQVGSGNLGTSNATIALGWRAGVLTGIHDIGKAVLAVLAARWLFPELPYIEVAAGCACVLGHIYPVFLKFKGGKGLASYLGMLLGLDWRLALGTMALIVLITVLTDYLVVGTVATVVIVPIGLGLLGNSWWPSIIMLPLTAVILWKHRENYPRILKGTEIGLRETIQGKNKVKTK